MSLIGDTGIAPYLSVLLSNLKQALGAARFPVSVWGQIIQAAAWVRPRRIHYLSVYYSDFTVGTPFANG
jgi:hypothetical protein